MDYATGRAIRNKGLSGLITQNLLNPEMGIGQSFTTALSDRTKATVTGIKEAFDPLNIAKKLTGGSKLAPALLGRLTGRNKTTIQHFSGRKSASASGVNFETGASLGPSASVQTLGFIFEELIKADEIKKQEQEDYYKNEAKRDKDELDRTVAIIAAISGKKVEAKAKKEYARDEKGRFVKKDRTRTTENKPDGMDVPKTRTTSTTPDGITKTTPKSLPTSPATSVAKEGVKKSVTSTAVKVAGGAAASVLGVSAAAAISIKGETSATTKEGILAKVGQIVPNDPKPGVSSYGIFGMNSAAGTVQQFVAQNPQFGFTEKPGTEQFNKEWTNVAKTRSEEFRDAQLKWHDETIVQPLRRELDNKLPNNIQSNEQIVAYMADRRIQYGKVLEGEAFKYASSATTPGEFIDKITEFDLNNIGRAFTTYLKNHPEAERGLKTRIENRKKLSLQLSDNVSGEQIDSKTKENKEMKKSVEADKRNATTVNSTTINSSSTSSPTPGKEKEQEDDRPAYIKKRRG